MRTPADWMHWVLGGVVKSCHVGLCELRAHLMGESIKGAGAKKRKAQLQELAKDVTLRFSSLMRYQCPESGYLVCRYSPSNILTVSKLTLQAVGQLIRCWR